MIHLAYSDMRFVYNSDNVKVIFKNKYYFFISVSKLKRIGNFKVVDGKLFMDISSKKITLIDNLINDGLDNLYNINKNKRTVYIYEGLVPLIGTNEFGIVDRNTSILEIKPSTGCNMNCVFCSVSEGFNNKIDYLVEPDYLINEIKKLVLLKKSDSIEINIGPQGEPLLYPDIVYLIKELKKIKKIKRVSMNSNGRLLNFKMIDSLVDAGLDRINLSVHNSDVNIQKKLSGSAISLDRLKRLIDYANNRIDFLLAPVYVPKLNEDLDGLIEFAKSYKTSFPFIGIQNFLNYKTGRNPVKQLSFDRFYDLLDKLEKKHGIKLRLRPEDFSIVKDAVLKKPFVKGSVVDAVIRIPGRNKNQCVAESGSRAITVYDCDFVKDKHIRVKILRDKHNIFSGVLV